MTRSGLVSGEVVGVAPDGSPIINSSQGKIKVNKGDILQIEMKAPEAVVQARQAVEAGNWAAVETAVAEPLSKFKGLQADWVIEAIGMQADAQLALKKNDEARKTYDEIRTAYAGTPYADKATVGLARLALAQAEGPLKEVKLADATRLLQPVLASANTSLMPDAARQNVLSSAFLAQGQMQELRGQKAEALESYCKVIALYPSSPVVVSQARGRADALRADGTLYVK